MRRFFSFFLLSSIALVVSAAQADTIHLKNGSVIKGKVASFADDQFIVVLDAGTGRSMSRAMIHISDVSRIEFDSAPVVSTDTSPAREAAPIQTTQPTETSPRSTQPLATERRSETPPDTQPPVVSREPETRQPEKPATIPTSTSDIGEIDRTPRKSGGQVRTATIDVAAKRDWTSTGLIVKRGDRIRVTATGTVTLDPASGQTSGPEGSEVPDPKKLMADQPTGALIAVISADNDDFIFIGRSNEFTATRDGLLFLSVNEGALSDNIGSYKATIEVQSQGGRKQ